MNIGFIGTGHISSSVIEGISKSNLTVKKIYISPRNQLIAKKLRKKFKKVNIAKHNQQVIDMSDWVFLAITPLVGENILRNLYFKKKHKIISFISTIDLQVLKQYTANDNITRVLPLPFIGIKKGPIIICPPDKKARSFFKQLGKVIEVKNENISKNFWATSSFMAPFYEMLTVKSNWLVSKGVKRKEAEDYVRELFLALSEDSIKKKNISLKQLVGESQTPGGINAQALKELKKKKFYKIQQKVLNSIFRRF